MNRKKILAILLLMMAAVLALTACASKGSIVILEKNEGAEFDVTLVSWNGSDTITMSLNAGDEVSVEIRCETGDIALDISGKNGSNPYSGKDLSSMSFTVTVEETDEYTFRLTGDLATGSLTMIR